MRNQLPWAIKFEVGEENRHNSKTSRSSTLSGTGLGFFETGNILRKFCETEKFMYIYNTVKPTLLNDRAEK